MFMKESVTSLRVYFILIALLSGFVNGNMLLAGSQGNIVIIIFSIIGLGFAVAYFYIGIALRKLITQSPNIIRGVILTSMGFLLLSFLLSLLGGVQDIMVAQLIIGILITWYLLNNVTRLSSEDQSKRET